MSHPWPLGLFINNVAQRGVEVFLLAVRKGIKGHAKGKGGPLADPHRPIKCFCQWTKHEIKF